MPLTDTAIRNARPGGKPVKLFDEGGLYLILTPAGARWWRLDYRYGGKRRTLSMGVYPHVSLKDGNVWSPELRLTDYGPLPHPTQLCGSICAVPRHMATIRVPLSAFGAHNNVTNVRLVFRGDSFPDTFIVDDLAFSEWILKP